MVNECQNNINDVINNPHTNLGQKTKQTLSILQEGLNTFISNVPSGLGFPFDLPAVTYSLKIIMSKVFFDEFMSLISDKELDPKLLSSLQELQIALSDYTSSDVNKNLEEIELLYAYYVELRLILENEDFSSNEIKSEIKLLLQSVKSQKIEYPMLQAIPNRLRKYWRYLFYCYDDKRIPRTNLEIEHSFNRLKRIKRKRTGVKNSPTYFTHEGKSLIQIENITDEYKDDSSESRFIDEFKSKRLLVSNEQLEKQTFMRDLDKSFFKSSYHKKIRLLEAGIIYEKLTDKIELI